MNMTTATTMPTTSPPEVNSEAFIKAVAYLKSGGDIFLTGAGGTGKSHTTRRLVKQFKNPIILGTTGLAAVNVGGETMHSFFRLQINKTLEDLKESDRRFISNFASQRNLSYERAEDILFAKLEQVLAFGDLIVLDEVSMATSNQLEMMLYRIQKLVPRHKIPFLFVGDLLQLPPVGVEEPIFESPFWKAKTWTLKKVWRTEDKDFYRVQRKVRWGIIDEEVTNFIESRQVTGPIDNKKIMLAATNKTVDAYNDKALSDLPGDVVKLEMKVQAQDNVQPMAIDKFIQDLAVAKTIDLKEGARVMITTNVYDTDVVTGGKILKYYNGQVGTYLGNSKDDIGIAYLDVITDIGHRLKVKRFEFEKISHKANGGDVEQAIEVVASQFPIRLAYALTIHKSQGQTLEAVHIHCRQIHNPGQFYVALSRCSNPDKLTFNYFHAKSHIYADERCKAFYGKP